MNTYRIIILLLIVLCIGTSLQAQDFGEEFKAANDLVVEGNAEEAIAKYQKLLKSYPKDSLIHLQLGLIYATQNDTRRAAEHLSKAASLKPDSFRANYYLGLVYLQQENYAKAIDSLKKSVALEPKNARALYDLGLAYASRRNYNEALQAYNRCIAVKPNYLNAYIGLAGVYEKMNKHTEALKQVKKLKQLGAYDLANGLANRLRQ